MISNKKKNLIRFLLGSMLFVLLFTNFYLIEIDLNKNQKINDYGLPKTSAYFNLTGQNINIDDSDPNYNWSKTAAENEWCSGEGIPANPYIIQNVLIDGSSSQALISIKNSNAYFTIAGCKLYTSSTWDYCISLSNVTNGIIYNNNCSSTPNYWGTIGISLYNSSDNSILNNFMQNNEIGIRLNGISNKNDLSNNEIKNCQDYGITIETDSSNNTVDNNEIYSNLEMHEICDYGIFIGGSENNITRNIIRTMYYRGIHLNWDSSDSYIAQNEISDVYGGGILTYGHFGDTIFNNTIHDITFWSGSSYYGIRAYEGGNHKIIGNTIERVRNEGILLENSHNNDVIDNVIDTSNSTGIYIENCQNFNISNNLVSNVMGFGLSLVDSESGEVSDNLLYGSGYNVDGSAVSMSSLDMDGSNQVNDKPLYFNEGVIGINNAMVSDAGQIILYSCVGIDISNLDFRTCSIGAAFYHCTILDLANIQASLNNVQGIKVISCNFTEIVGSNLSNNAVGIYYSDCRDLVINDCIINSNTGNGISGGQGTEIMISDCTITYNQGNGIYSQGNGTIEDNVISRNEINGILLSSSKMNVSSNTLTYNWISGIEVSYSSNCTIIGNTASRNGDFGIYLFSSKFCDIIENTCDSNINSSVSWDWDSSGIFIGGNYASSYYECSSYGNRILKNILTNNDESITMEHSFDDTVAENTFDALIYLYRVISLNFTKNTINIEFSFVSSGNQEVYLRECYNFTVTYNTFQNTGISMEQCSYNTFVGNKIYDCSLAFDLDDSSYNNIINNTILRAGQCFREMGSCIGNVFEGNICEGLMLPLLELGALIGGIAVAAVTGLMYFKRRKYMRS